MHMRHFALYLKQYTIVDQLYPNIKLKFLIDLSQIL